MTGNTLEATTATAVVFDSGAKTRHRNQRLTR